MRKIVLVLATIAAVGFSPGNAAATPPTEVVFAVETNLVSPAPAPFGAFGQAVDDGIVCSVGTVSDATGKATGFTRNGFNFQGIKQFTCEGGEFFINLQARIDFRRGVTFHWNVLRGTGDFENLHGAGQGVGIPAEPCGDPDECVLDVYFGGLHID